MASLPSLSSAPFLTISSLLTAPPLAEPKLPLPLQHRGTHTHRHTHGTPTPHPHNHPTHYTQAPTHVHVPTPTHRQMHSQAITHIYTPSYPCVCKHICVGTHICIGTHTDTLIPTHTHTHTSFFLNVQTLQTFFFPKPSNSSNIFFPESLLK